MGTSNVLPTYEDVTGVCAVIECEAGKKTTNIYCGECMLYFCSELHGPHPSHSLQMLDPRRHACRPSRIEGEVGPSSSISFTYPPVATVASSSNVDLLSGQDPMEEQSKEQEQMENRGDTIPPISPTAGAKRSRSQRGGSEDSIGELATSSVIVERFVEARTANAFRTSTSASGSDMVRTAAVLPTSGMLTSARRLEGDNSSARDHIEAEKLRRAAEFLRELIADDYFLRQDKIDTCYSRFHYPSAYDVTFLVALAGMFNVDVREAITGRKRVTPKEVLLLLLSKLF